MEILKNPNFDFLGKARYFIAGSLILILSGLAYMATRGIHYGVEFSGGTQLIVKFQNPPHVDRIRGAVESVAPGAVIQTYGQSSSNQLLFQLIYIGFRFKGAVWGAAATVAVFHDVLVTLGLLAFFRYEITLNVIAALLTLVGYSVNDTIVIFDRARENLRQKRKEPLRKILNDSVNQTLTRTLISNGTTFLSVLGLYLFGGEVLRGFGFAMVVGILVGTYSTIYIASPLVVWWTEMRARRRHPSTARAAL